ncbi:GyrI-like domain-containing protein [Micromonospora sp. WMMD734]|uniref:GyrI-like domain-containing protein n=1 Tax=Micromonospora sp. WMMD734 TaxID=3404129 RepID=UPI003B965CE4
MTDPADGKVDFRRTLDAYRAHKGRFRLVDVPDMQYLMIDGRGDPNSAPAFTGAVEALYPVAYRVKFASRRELGRDYVVPPLEGLWWAEDMTSFTSARDTSRWRWTLMLMVPDWIAPGMVTAAVALAGAKRPPGRLDDVRLERLAEGRCVQTLHVGSFDDETAVLARLHHEFVPTHGLRLTGTHHEIYLSDFRRVAPDRRRTILRQPVAADTRAVGERRGATADGSGQPTR